MRSTTNPRTLSIVATCLLLGASTAVLAQDEAPTIEWQPQENKALEMKWMRPSNEKWLSKTNDHLNKGESHVDRIVRAESASATPDMQMTITAWESQSGGVYNTFPLKTDDELRKIVSSDPVMKQHSEFGTRMAQLFKADRVDQAAILDQIAEFAKSNKIKKFGKQLDTILKQHDKKEYMRRVEMKPGNAGQVADYFLESCQLAMSGYRGPKKVGTAKCGTDKAKYFKATGRHKDHGAKITMEYYILGSVKQHTVVIEIIYWGGMEADKEVKAVTQQIVSSISTK